MLAVILLGAWSAVNVQNQRPRAEPAQRAAQQNVPEETLGDPAHWQPITWFTLLLVLVGAGQAVLFFWQIGFLRSADETARRAADASKIMADAAILSAERAIDAQSPLIRLVDCRWLDADGKPFAPAWRQTIEANTFVTPVFSLKNYGSSVAIIGWMSAVQKISKICVAPDRNGMLMTQVVAEIEGNGTATLPQAVAAIKITPEQFFRLSHHLDELYLIGSFAFQDKSGETFEVGFAGFWNVPLGGDTPAFFARVGPVGYNYQISHRRKEKAPYLEWYKPPPDEAT